MDKNESEIKAVHEQDLEETLKKIGALENIKASRVKCKFCDTHITLANLHSILPHSQGFSFICDNPECVTKLMNYLEGRNRVTQG